MAVAGSAPAYSIAATTALLVSTVGFAGPAALLWCGIPMFGIALAYHQLNKMGASAGRRLRVGRSSAPPIPRLADRLVRWSSRRRSSWWPAHFPPGQVTLSLFSATAASHTWAVAARRFDLVPGDGLLRRTRRPHHRQRPVDHVLDRVRTARDLRDPRLHPRFQPPAHQLLDELAGLRPLLGIHRWRRQLRRGRADRRLLLLGLGRLLEPR